MTFISTLCHVRRNRKLFSEITRNGTGDMLRHDSLLAVILAPCYLHLNRSDPVSNKRNLFGGEFATTLVFLRMIFRPILQTFNRAYRICTDERIFFSSLLMATSKISLIRLKPNTEETENRG